jgi:hypothetical protein
MSACMHASHSAHVKQHALRAAHGCVHMQHRQCIQQEILCRTISGNISMRVPVTSQGSRNTSSTCDTTTLAGHMRRHACLAPGPHTRHAIRAAHGTHASALCSTCSTCIFGGPHQTSPPSPAPRTSSACCALQLLPRWLEPPRTPRQSSVTHAPDRHEDTKLQFARGKRAILDTVTHADGCSLSARARNL